MTATSLITAPSVVAYGQTSTGRTALRPVYLLPPIVLIHHDDRADLEDKEAPAPLGVGQGNGKAER